jgi:allophanate hydrolase subunit 2
MSGHPVFEVLAPGLQTTIQDAGRPGHRDQGVPLAGACDPLSLAVANPGRTHHLRAGERLAVPGSAAATGCREYLAVPGGLDVPIVMGSRSTSLVGGFGGIHGRALRSGDLLYALSTSDRIAPAAPADRAWLGTPLRAPDDSPARVLPAPGLRGADSSQLLDQLLSATWGISPASDRRGLRLVGPSLHPAPRADGGSHGVIPGTIQLTPDGTPLVLLVDAGTTGGYPVIGVVISADLAILGQARPGGILRFLGTDLSTARQAMVELRATLGGD